MSDDEVVVLLIAGAVALIYWLWWLFRVLRYPPFISPWSDRFPLLLTPALSAIALFYILIAYASPDVRTSSVYLFFYMVLGAAWIGVFALLIPYFGIAYQDDVIERRNSAAVYPIAGALIGIAACYGGGNIGAGPGWWVVVISAGLATLGLFAAWFLLETFTQISYTITVERDISAGLRLTGFLIAIGIFLGRAVAGDWVSFDATFADFIAYGLPVLAIVVFAIVIEFIARPSIKMPVPSTLIFGAVPAVLYVGVAALIVAPQIIAMTH